MDKNEIFEIVAQIINENFNKEVTDGRMQLGAGDAGLELNSIEIVQLVVLVEEKFDIIFDFDRLFYTVDEIVEEVNQQCHV